MVGKKDDITLDFSWITNLFSKKDKKNKKQQKNNKIINIATIIILILIPLILSIYIRSLPNKLGIAEEWGQNSIYNVIRNDVSAQVSAQYPNLPEENRQALINEEYNRQIAQNKAQIDQYVIQQAEGLKSRFKDESGETYLGDIDSYFWLRYTRNIIEKGDIADERREGIPYDNHMSAPSGYKLTPNLYPYIEAWLYKFVKIFNSKFSLMGAAYYTPMFLSFIAIIAAFFIGKKISGNFSGFVAAILIAVNPTVLSRSFGSDNDIVNAVFPLLIMLFVFYAFDSKNYKETIIYAGLTGLLTGLYSFAWSGWWFMFLFIIGAGIAYIVYTIGRDFIKSRKVVFNNKKVYKVLILIGIYLIASFVSLSFFGNQGSFLRAFRNPLKIISINSASKGFSLWPNVYTTVAELNSANMDQIIGSLGGKMFLVLALLGTIFNLVKFKPENKILNTVYLLFSALYFMVFVDLAKSNTINLIVLLVLISLPMLIGLLLSIIFDYELDPTHSLIMTIWFMATIYASTKGIRFILLIIPAFVISFSVIMGEFVKKVSDWIGNSLDMHKSIPKIIGIVIVLMVLVQPIKSGIRSGYNYVPSVNDAWVNTLTKIRLESNEDSIINSWWDFGHWFKYWADRRVTFDGASQNSQHAHWMGKILLTDDEEQAISILKMLDCGGKLAEAEIYKLTEKDTLNSVNFVYNLFSLDRDSAKQELLKITNETKTEEILNYMYCEPPDNYFITSGDMVGKSGVWAHFGSWNFERAKIYQYYKTKTYEEFISTVSTELPYSEEQAKTLYYELSAKTTDRDINDWIAPWPNYIMGSINSCSKTNNTLVCPYNVDLGSNGQQRIIIERAIIDLSNLSQTQLIYGFYSLQNNQKMGENSLPPSGIDFASDGKFEKTNIDKAQNFEILLYENNDQYKSMLFQRDSPLIRATFTKLFFLDGFQSESFERFSDMTDVTGSRIITWTINWEN